MLVADLDDSIRFREHGADLFDLLVSFDQYLFAVHMLAGIQRVEQGLGMKIKRRGNENGVDVRIIEDSPVVVDRTRFITDDLFRLIQPERKDVAYGANLVSRQIMSQAKQFLSLPAGADVAGAQDIAIDTIRTSRNEAGRRRQGRRCGGRADEFSSFHELCPRRVAVTSRLMAKITPPRRRPRWKQKTVAAGGYDQHNNATAGTSTSSYCYLPNE